jgi:hypothetical protein
LVKRSRLALQAAIALVFITNASAIACWVSLQNAFLATFSFLMSLPFDMYLFYLLLIIRRKPQYPLVPPEGKWDMYLPRTDIPRPIIADSREIEEKKRKFAKVNKMTRKKMVRKKK